MDYVLPASTEVVAAILALSSGGEGPIPVARIHSILYEMKPHEPVLSGIRFSITGDVCYSRKVDWAIKALVDQGALAMVGETAVSVERRPLLRTRFLTTFTYSQFHALETASRRFYERLRHRGAPRQSLKKAL